MKTRFLKFAFIALGCAAVTGCHRHEDGDHHHDEEHTESHSHGDDAQSFSGATHKEGEGITLLPETKERLGIQLADAEERSIPKQIRFGARVFAVETAVLASAVIRTQDAQLLSPGTPITLRTGDEEPVDGTVLKTIAAVSPSETEIVVQAPKSSGIEIGSFLQGTVTINSDKPVMTVPKEAVIRGATDTFVYVQNGGAYLRTPVEVGRETRDAVEIEDGLLEGDTVVSQGAMDLWLVELRAVKGGQGCCPAPPSKGKGK